MQHTYIHTITDAHTDCNTHTHICAHSQTFQTVTLNLDEGHQLWKNLRSRCRQEGNLLPHKHQKIHTDTHTNTHTYANTACQSHSKTRTCPVPFMCPKHLCISNPPTHTQTHTLTEIALQGTWAWTVFSTVMLTGMCPAFKSKRTHLTPCECLQPPSACLCSANRLFFSKKFKYFETICLLSPWPFHTKIAALNNGRWQGAETAKSKISVVCAEKQRISPGYIAIDMT